MTYSPKNQQYTPQYRSRAGSLNPIQKSLVAMVFGSALLLGAPSIVSRTQAQNHKTYENIGALIFYAGLTGGAISLLHKSDNRRN